MSGDLARALIGDSGSKGDAPRQTKKEVEETRAAIEERGEPAVLADVEIKDALLLKAPKCERCGAVMVDFTSKWVCPKNSQHPAKGKG
jgi:ribosomal protein S27AE